MRNRLIDALAADVLGALQPHMRTRQLSVGELVAESGQDIEYVYFPHSGVISPVVEMTVGDTIDTAMVGRDGFVGGLSSLDGNRSLYTGIVQIAGDATVIRPDIVRQTALAFPQFHSLIIPHEQVLLAEAQQSAGRNASHSVEERMCRWLLRMRDLTSLDELSLTQEFLAQMPGVRQTGVSLAASALQKAGLIQYRRGNIRLLKVDKLRVGSCECYDTVRAHHERMLGRQSR